MTPDTKPQNLSPNEQQDLDNRLIAAASNGNTATVQTLLAHGADVHARNDHALRRAADTGHTETVKVLLAAGADIHAIDDQALRWAAEGGCTETVNLLLAHDADVHALDDGALRVAVDNGHTETVKALIASGADVHAEDDWALRLAAFNSHLETETGIVLTELANVAAIVATAAVRPIPLNKAIVGGHVFTHESGIHVDGLLKDRRTYQALDPALLGRSHRFVMGKHSGLAAIAASLSELKLRASSRELPAILARVREHAIATKTTVTAD